MSNQHIVEFLKDLKKNNNRQWFSDNRQRYDDSLAFFKTEVKQLIDSIGSFDPSIAYLTPEQTIFRIYRDIRFSPDKTPYKTHFGAYIAPNGGRKSPLAGYYFHIDSDFSLLAGGAYCPSPSILRQIRKDIDACSEDFFCIIKKKIFKQYFGTVKPFSEPLKRLPMGFSKDSPVAEILKYKHFVVEHNLSDERLFSKDFVDYATDVFCAMKPFNDFFNEIIENHI